MVRRIVHDTWYVENANDIHKYFEASIVKTLKPVVDFGSFVKYVHKFSDMVRPEGPKIL